MKNQKKTERLLTPKKERKMVREAHKSATRDQTVLLLSQRNLVLAKRLRAVIIAFALSWIGYGVAVWYGVKPWCR